MSVLFYMYIVDGGTFEPSVNIVNSFLWAAVIQAAFIDYMSFGKKRMEEIRFEFKIIRYNPKHIQLTSFTHTFFLLELFFILYNDAIFLPLQSGWETVPFVFSYAAYPYFVEKNLD